MSCKGNRKSASKWEQSSERALLEIWGAKMSELRGCRKNSHIIQEMEADLQAQGFYYSVMEIKTKMHNMTARYRKEKQQMGTTGGSPSEWDLFKEMELVLAPYKSYNSEGLVCDSITHKSSNIGCQSSSTNSAKSPPASATVPSPATVAPSPSIASPLPSPSTVPSPLPSPTATQNSDSAAPSCSAGMKKRGLDFFFKSMEKKMDNWQESMEQTSERVLAIEEEKKTILKAYVDREADVQKALIEFLKRP